MCACGISGAAETACGLGATGFAAGAFFAASAKNFPIMEVISDNNISTTSTTINPTAENIIMTPISAHTLQAKAMVLNKDRRIDVTVPKQSRKTAYLSVDGGKAFKLYAGDTVEVMRSRRSLCLVKLSGKSFYEVINQKLERRSRA